MPSLCPICSSFRPASNIDALAPEQLSPDFCPLRIDPPSIVDTVMDKLDLLGLHPSTCPWLSCPDLSFAFYSPNLSAPSVLSWGTHDPHPNAYHVDYSFKYNLFSHLASTCSKLASLRLNHPGPCNENTADLQYGHCLSSFRVPPWGLEGNTNFLPHPILGLPKIGKFPLSVMYLKDRYIST